MQQKPTVKACPYCFEQIHVKATKCRFCGEMYDGSVPPSIKALANALGFDTAKEPVEEPQEEQTLEGYGDNVGAGGKRAKLDF